MIMKIKNWKTFQHFKDRRPPWIKLHREMLDQRDINMISDRSFRLLINLWLLASEDKAMDGNLPEIEDIAFRLRIKEEEIIVSLHELTPWVEQDDIIVISGQYQVVPPETETEEYKKETEKKTVSRFAPPSTNEVKEYCLERKNFVDAEKFIDHYTANGWKVGRNKMKDWKAAVRTWEKNSVAPTGGMSTTQPSGRFRADDI